VPARIEDAPTVQGERVEVLNVLGAGDAFAAGLMTGFLTGKDFVEAARLANACGAIVVSRHACAPAMPTPASWTTGSAQVARKVDADAQLAHLHRTTAARPAWPSSTCSRSTTAASSPSSRARPARTRRAFPR